MSIFTRKIGTTIRTSVVFSPIGGGAPEDPGVVTCTVEKPDETFVTYTTNDNVVHDGDGTYHLDIANPDQAGVWTIEWTGFGSGPNVVEDANFRIDASAID